ncbi:MAG: hypothetical protein IJ688_03205 [Treponema sp.]|nr:hypothetical protein [Treponema sp.]
MNKIKIIIMTGLLILLPQAIHAKITCFWDFGQISASGVFNEENGVFAPLLELPDAYFVGEKTGLFASLCPFSIKFAYTPQDYEYEGHREDWSIDSVSFVNIDIGWMKYLGDDFLLETFVGLNTVNVMDMKSFSISPALEISWTPDFLAELADTSKIQFMPKAVSLTAGASFCNRRNFRPDFFVSLSLDFILFAGLTGTLIQM